MNGSSLRRAFLFFIDATLLETLMHPPKAIKPFGPQAALLDPTHAGQSALILSLAQSPADATGTIIFLELKLQPSIVV